MFVLTAALVAVEKINGGVKEGDYAEWWVRIAASSARFDQISTW